MAGCSRMSEPSIRHTVPRDSSGLQGNSPQALRHRTALTFGAAVAGCVFAIWVLWHTLAAILASDQGLDITDEGLYLLAADPPSPTASWGFPWGWHTGPLFQLVSYDIAAFRTLGAVLLVLAGAWFGWESVSTSQAMLADRSRPPAPTRPERCTGLFVGAFGMLTYYGGLLRTPSYNWLNLFGILVATAAFLAVLRRLLQPANRGWRGAQSLSTLTCSFGLFLTIPAKPSTAPLVLVLMLCVMSVSIGFGKAARWTAAFSAGIAVWLVVAVALRVWPLNFVPVMIDALNTPPLSKTQGLGGAIKGLLAAPYSLAAALWHVPVNHQANLVVAASLFAVRAKWRLSSSLLVPLAVVLVGLSASRIAQLWVPFIDAQPTDRFAYRPTTTACLLLLGSLVLAGFERRGYRASGQGTELLFLFLALSALPFIFGFGSGHGPYKQASLASGIFLVVALASIVVIETRSARAILTGLIVVFTLALTTSTLLDSRERPYRIAPIAEQTATTTFGSRTATLQLDDDLHSVIESLGDQARAAGWVDDTPLVGVAWRWSSTVPYALGARVPESLMPTLFGYSGTAEAAQHNLARSRDDFPYDEAWVLVTPSRLLDESNIAKTSEVLKIVAIASGRSFPQGYECVAQSGQLLLWRPSTTVPPSTRSVPEAKTGCPDAEPAWSGYSSSLGFSSSD